MLLLEGHRRWGTDMWRERRERRGDSRLVDSGPVVVERRILSRERKGRRDSSTPDSVLHAAVERHVRWAEGMRRSCMEEVEVGKTFRSFGKTSRSLGRELFRSSWWSSVLDTSDEMCLWMPVRLRYLLLCGQCVKCKAVLCRVVNGGRVHALSSSTMSTASTQATRFTAQPRPGSTQIDQ